MSDKVLIPPPNKLYASDNSLMRYRAAFTSLCVVNRPDNGRRLEVWDDGRQVIFDLSADQAKHLADLLCEPIAEGRS